MDFSWDFGISIGLSWWPNSKKRTDQLTSLTHLFCKSVFFLRVKRKKHILNLRPAEMSRFLKIKILHFVSGAMLISDVKHWLKWVPEVSGRIFWNPAWQAGCAGMHVINKAQKTSKRMSLSYSVTHTSVCSLAPGSFVKLPSLLYLHFHLKRKQKHFQQS